MLILNRTNRISLELGSLFCLLLGGIIIYNVRLHPKMHIILSYLGQGIGAVLIAAGIVAAIIVVEAIEK